MYKNELTTRSGGCVARPACALNTAPFAAIAIAAAAAVTLMSSTDALAQHKPAPGMQSATTQAAEDRMLGQAPASPLRRHLEELVTSEAVEARLNGEVGDGAMTAIRQAYARDVFEPIWTRKGAFDFYDAVAENFDRGLVVEQSTMDALDDLISQRFGDDPAAAAEADVELTAAFVRLASLVSGGLRDEGRAAEPHRDAPNRAVLTNVILRAGQGDIGSALDKIEPTNTQYRALKGVMKHYRTIAAEGGWPAIPEGELVREGQRDPRVPALRERLAVEGFHDPANVKAADMDRLDWRLVADLKEFQRRHGLEPDGVIGPNTLTALNESVESKLDRIADAMHRWRTQGYMGTRYVWANIPSFTAEGWNNGKREIAMKTIVGRPDRMTPQFSDQVEYVVTNPKWNVPVSIARKDKLPKLQKDPGYANRGNYKIFDRKSGAQVSPYSIDWNDPSSAERYKFVQGPGDDNALGRLKIIFPNQYSVHMHDTPSKHLFKEARRTFSSGCVRLEHPVRMARWIAGIDPSLTEQEIDERLADRENKWLPVSEPVPVHITYMTVTVDDQDRAFFWRDVYDRVDGIRMATRLAPLQKPHPRNLSKANTDSQENG